ncbi:MAG: diguanylate cyclase [Proteobacteria bacterium]|nr:diguanylate cyclase [Pseudomonadota bacterium]
MTPFTEMWPPLERAWHLSCEGQVEAAMALAQQVHDEARAAEDQKLRSSAASHLGWYCFMLGYYEEGILHVLSARDFYRAIGDLPRESWTRAIHAWLLIEIGAPNEALDEAMLALELAEATAEQRALCFALNVVGVVFWMQGQLDRALQFAERSVTLARLIGDRVELGRWLINLAGIEAEFWYQAQTNADAQAGPRSQFQAERGAAYSGMGDAHLLRAVTLADEARQLAHEAGDSWANRLALCNLAEYHLGFGQRERAAEVLAQWDSLRGGDGIRSRIYYLFALGKLQLAEGSLDEAIRTLLECATMAGEAGDLEIGVPCCRYLADAFAAAGQFAEALHWHREFHARHVRKSTDTSLVRSRVAAIQYETRQLQARIETERTRADGLEQINRVLVQEAALLMHASMEDVLTGLPNRRGLERALLEVATGATGNYAFAMMDIDHFKRVNDTFSHALGDEVLRQVAMLLRAATRDTDRLFRYGGEEFVLLMGATDILLAAKICRRIRQAVRSWNWAQIHPNLRITLSIGVAIAGEAIAPVDVMALADERLYQAKNAGRDRIVMDGRGKIQHVAVTSPLIH